MRAEKIHLRLLGVVIILVTAFSLVVSATAPVAHDPLDGTQQCLHRAQSGGENVVGPHPQQTLKLGAVAKIISNLPSLFAAQRGDLFAAAPRPVCVSSDTPRARSRICWADLVDLRI